jgi:hypothetical protein
VRLTRGLFSLFCDGGISGPLSIRYIDALFARSFVLGIVCCVYVHDSGNTATTDCAHRLDESRELPVCASRGWFAGGVWRSA